MDREFRTQFMPRITTPSPKDQDPTVRVIINGLALLCFSKKNNGRAEVGFLKTATPHPLLFTIYDRSCTDVTSQFLQLPGLPELPDGADITVNSKHPGLGQLYTPDTTPKPKESDDEDFRHLLNLDEMHFKVFGHRNVQIKADSTYLAKLFISNGTFYNAKRSTNPAKIRNRNGPPEDFPKVGKVIGANIMDTQVFVTVNTDSFDLSRGANSPYTIILRYKCEHGPSAETDFERFHNVLNLPARDVLDVFYGTTEPADRVGCEVHFEKAFDEKKLSEKALRDKGVKQLIRAFRRSEEACQTSMKPECPGNLLGEPEGCP
jgi:hypothetical protein